MRVASVCSGTFVLAEAGLLDGKPRHHALAAHAAISRGLSEGEARARPDFVRDGNIWSSAGITAGIDLALAMAAEDYGDGIVERPPANLSSIIAAAAGSRNFPRCSN